MRPNKRRTQVTFIPEPVRHSSTCLSLIRAGLSLAEQGKVRNIHLIPPHGWEELRLFHASNRLSLADCVLPVEVVGKGAALTAFDHFWRTQVFPDQLHHLASSFKYPGRNAVHDLKEYFPSIPLETCMVVRNYPERFKAELIVRDAVGGSVWSEYLETGIVAGQRLPANLHKWERLPEPIFTPSTKAPAGEHDVNMPIGWFLENYGEVGEAAVEKCLDLFKRAQRHVEARGVLLLDTKFELAILRVNDGFILVIIDEMFTPDSSRYTTLEGYEAAMSAGTEPPSFDKEAGRIWARGLVTPWDTAKKKGLSALDLSDSDHRDFLSNLAVPTEITDGIKQRYPMMFELAADKPIEQYQKEDMFIGAAA